MSGNQNNPNNILHEKPTFERYGKNFQENLVQLILDDRAFADQISEVLDTNFLELKYLRLFIDKIFEYRKKYGTHPSRDTITTILCSDLDKENELLQKQTREFYARISANEFSVDGEQHMRDDTIDVDVEAKMKNLAVLKLRKDYGIIV